MTRKGESIRGKRWSVHTCTLLVFFGCAGASAYGQDGARFKRESLSVVAPATTFIEEAQGSRAYPLHQSVVLTRRRSKASADIHAKVLQARVFRLSTPRRDMPEPWHTIGDCDVYISHVIEVPRAADQADNALPLGRFDDDGWLEPNIGAGRMEHGRYLIVFEQSADAQSVFRLRHVDRGEYFRQGYLLILEPPPARTYSPSEVRAIRDRLEDLRGGLENEVGRNDPSRVCYEFRAVVPVLNETGQINLVRVPCEASTY